MKHFLLLLFLFVINVARADDSGLKSNLSNGQLLIKRNKTEEALNAFYAGLQQSLKENNLLFQGKFYLELADLLLLLNQVDSLDSYYGKAAAIFEKLNLKSETIRSKTGMLEVSRRTNPSSTMDKYIELLKEARAIRDNDVYYNVLDKIILVNNGMENYPEAMSQTHECINYYKSTNDSLRLGVKYRELGSLFFTHFVGRNGPAYERDSCIYYLQKSIVLFNQINSYGNLVFAYQRLSWLLYKTDIDAAWRYIITADSIDKLYHIQSPQLPNIMSFSLFKMGRTREAIEKSKESLKLGMKAKQLFIGIQAADQLCEYYKSIKEVDSALLYKELSMMLNDSIRSQKQYKDAVRMQTKMEFDKELFHKEIIQQEEMKRSRLIIYFFLLMVGLLIIILTLIYRAYNQSKKSNNIIMSQNNEKTLLIREIHHRVKNNLTLVSGLLDLQQREIKDEQLINIFKEAKSRISSMALVHQKLYEQENFTHIDVQQYFENLFQTIFSTYKPKEKNIEGRIECHNIEMNIDTLIPLALITNELLTNTFKYAFEGRSTGKIEIKLSQTEVGYLFYYGDDGIGLNASITESAGLGTRLIKGLCKQLKGTLIKKNVADAGLIYQIAFEGINSIS